MDKKWKNGVYIKWTSKNDPKNHGVIKIKIDDSNDLYWRIPKNSSIPDTQICIDFLLYSEMFKEVREISHNMVRNEFSYHPFKIQYTSNENDDHVVYLVQQLCENEKILETRLILALKTDGKSLLLPPYGFINLKDLYKLLWYEKYREIKSMMETLGNDFGDRESIRECVKEFNSNNNTETIFENVTEMINDEFNEFLDEAINPCIMKNKEENMAILDITLNEF